ncbi:MAG: class I SAM-dependent methyltransferase [Gaiellaceae bacterium MAG52_C11]|nr:class I SAM-dependent methyltransferase [Candidatus Gaiellasilicea maunaloa]
MNLNDPKLVAEEYANEKGLVGRRDAYRYADGLDAPALAIGAVLDVQPRRVLEVGCGPGEAAERIAASGVEVEALDISERMVELTRARGVNARVGDVQELPFEDESFDAALAGWMLYHVPDVERGVAELARVLRPGGRLVAVTNRREHLRELRELLGGDFPTHNFSDENGAEILLRHFAQVEERDAGGWINFPDRAAVEAYVKSSRSLWERDLPANFEGTLRVRRAPVIYVATKAT